MSVSLKKPSEEIHKVDLSKPAMPCKLPECTPVHLIDEEETIKSCAVRLKSSDSSSDLQIRFHHSEEEDRHIWDRLYEELNELRHTKRKRVITAVSITVLVIVLAVLVVVLVLNFGSSDILSLSFSGVFSIMSDVFDWLSGSPVVMLFLAISFFYLGIHFIRLLINIIMKYVR